nr:hypothetical protein OG690_20890 [Streptomyces tubercidicus]
MTAISGATTHPANPAPAPALIARTALEFPAATYLAHQPVSAHHLGNQDWV